MIWSQTKSVCRSEMKTYSVVLEEGMQCWVLLDALWGSALEGRMGSGGCIPWPSALVTGLGWESQGLGGFCYHIDKHTEFQTNVFIEPVLDRSREVKGLQTLGRQKINKLIHNEGHKSIPSWHTQVYTLTHTLINKVLFISIIHVQINSWLQTTQGCPDPTAICVHITITCLVELHLGFKTKPEDITQAS